jgi:ketosteroid isomerase-like protein
MRTLTLFLLFSLCCGVSIIAAAQTSGSMPSSAVAAQAADRNAAAQAAEQAPGAMARDAAARNSGGISHPLEKSARPGPTNGVKEGFANVKSITFSANDDAVVHHAGKLAWGTTTIKTVITDKAGKVTNVNGRWTIVWEKKGENWVIVHDHVSAPMPM